VAKTNDRAHYTEVVESWERIMVGNAFVWGPMFLLGMLSLSDLMRTVTSLYIEHLISNLQFPIYVYSMFLLSGVAIQTDDWYQWMLAGLYSIFTIVSFGIQVYNGANAMYYLIDGKSKHADSSLSPSLFYLLGWQEHSERYFPYESNSGVYY